MTKTTAQDFPDLRIIPVGKIIPHELHDEQRAHPLVARLKKDMMLKSPILVTEADKDDDETDFIILDGTNRSIALDLLGVGDALVQVVPYEEPFVKLLTWNHAICGSTTDGLREGFSNTPGLSVTSCITSEARREFLQGNVQAYCCFDDQNALTMTGIGEDLAARAQFLQGIVASYIRDTRVNRVITDDCCSLRQLYPDMVGVVVFPSFKPEDIMELVKSGLRVPAGITRHLINGRALRINYPLSELSSAEPADKKNDKLQKWMREKFARKEARFYAEPTYIFDE